MPISIDLSKAHTDLERARDAERIQQIHDRLHNGDEPMCGWLHYPATIAPDLIEDIKSTAATIRNSCTTFLVVGIGGSFLGAKAAIELLTPIFLKNNGLGNPHIVFVGQHLSSMYYQELFTLLDQEDICLVVISKSGNTLEPTVIFSMLKALMREKYGDQAAERIYAVTDCQDSVLYDEALSAGYKTFHIPSDIGGRYSVLTPVGLLPMAVAGIDIDAVLDGARAAREKYSESRVEANDCYRYALARYRLAQSGKNMEIFEVYEGQMRYFTEWLRQLFAESECKEGKGLFPATMQMTTDLHSLGQFLQDGRQDFIETVISIVDVPETLYIPDGIAGTCTQLQCLNTIIRESVCHAHQINNTPNILLEISEISPYTFGEMVYFFEKACAVSCYLTGVNPFDQPGVEQYKRNIKCALYDENCGSCT